jgi:competence protein ComEC
LTVRHTADAVTRLRSGWLWTVPGWMAAARAQAQETIKACLPPESQNVARALLLGDQEALEQEDWDRYQRTGVIHVLAVSGQHLVVLAWFLGTILRLLCVSQRRGAVAIGLLLFAYALFTGGQPPVMRAVVMVCAFYGGLLLHRVTLPHNGFAFAWLLLCAWDPSAVFYAGFQLSFLSVAVLVWGTAWLQSRNADPLDRLTEETRPLWQRFVRSVFGKVALAYGVTALVWLALAPLVAARYHMVCPSALLIGPPVVLLTSVALLSGFAMLLIALVVPPLAAPFAWLTSLSLSGSELLIHLVEGLPGAYWYVPDLPVWWLWCFYLLLLAGMVLPLLRRYWLWVGLALLSWLCLGLGIGLWRPATGEVTCTFLAVGHGGCVVLETPDGRTVVYDAGAIAGPEVTRKYIAPYLWSRGIRRVDELFLSHADLDHFNGVPDLVERFAVGQVSCTPTFAQREIPAVRLTLQAVERRGIPIRVVQAGDRLGAGDVQMQVLHPPTLGPDGKENARSLVLLIQHRDHAILLTGDLEEAGLRQVLNLPRVPVDVLMAPHHGSAASNNDDVAKWATPAVVVSCQGRPRLIAEEKNCYQKRGATYLTTWEHGAVTIRSTADGLWVETYRTAQRWKVR